MPEETGYLVLELGMNHAQEIAALTRLAEPAVGVITCLAPVHLEGLGGGMEAVAAAKAELLEELGPAAVAVVPGDEPLLDPWIQRLSPERRIRFGRGPDDEVRLARVCSLGTRGLALELSLRGQALELTLPLVGEHNASNAAAAAGAALALGATPEDVARGLRQRPELGHRSLVRELGRLRVLDDCYNANPVAMLAALRTLLSLAEGAPAVAVLGSMLELGPEQQRYHHQLGRQAAGLGLAGLVTVGQLAAATSRGALEAGMAAALVDHTENPRAAAELAAELAGDGGWILVKASRGARLEQVIRALEDLCQQQ